MSNGVTYKSGLYAINTQEGRVGSRKEVFVGRIRFNLTRLWWAMSWKPHRLMEINGSYILYERGCNK